MCTICNGHPNCPCCSEDPVECTACEGGYIYILYNDKEELEVITAEQYESFLGMGMDVEKQKCTECEGIGEIYN